QSDSTEIGRPLVCKSLEHGRGVVVDGDAVVAAGAPARGERATRKLALKFRRLDAGISVALPHQSFGLTECRQTASGRVAYVLHRQLRGMRIFQNTRDRSTLCHADEFPLQPRACRDAGLQVPAIDDGEPESSRRHGMALGITVFVERDLHARYIGK